MRHERLPDDDDDHAAFDDGDDNIEGDGDDDNEVLAHSMNLIKHRKNCECCPTSLLIVR